MPETTAKNEALNVALQQVAEKIRKAETVMIATHTHPDGDCLGSGLALRLALRKMGKKVHVVNRDEVPGNLTFLPGKDTILHPGEVNTPYDLLVFVDCADRNRVVDMNSPSERELFEHLWQLSDEQVQMDHHGTNPGYCTVNAVDAQASAAAVLVWKLLPLLPVELDRDIAICLYAALLTDTGNFAQDNVNADSFSMMADLMGADLPLVSICRTAFQEKGRKQVSMMRRALNSLRFSADGCVNMMTLSAQDFAEENAGSQDVDMVVEMGRDIEGVHMAMLATEREEGIKISFRSIAPWRVDTVAAMFGGGGHRQAAGATVTGKTLSEAAEQVFESLMATHAEQKSALGL
ncbi:MAG: DHH family phosphoesterase [Clostridia bacterium]|nr:DHH family phosphoesterase [Clostridia bacterium]